MKMNANIQIRVLLAQRALTISKLARMLEERTGKSCTRQNLSNKLRAGTIRYDDMLIIADILGFEISFDEKK